MAESGMTALVEQLGIGRDLIAFVGGGGKSTLMLTLGREIADAGDRVVMGTTTKMGSDQIPPWATVCRTAAEVTAAVDEKSPAFLLERIERPKVIGADKELFSDLFSRLDTTVIVEADGARRRPFKAPGPHEPVVPAESTIVVVVAGIDAVGLPIAASCHRPERVATIIGASTDTVLRPVDVATVAASPDGGRKHVPPTARLILAVTKVGAEHGDAVEAIQHALPPDIELVVIPHE